MTWPLAVIADERAFLAEVLGGFAVVLALVVVRMNRQRRRALVAVRARQASAEAEREVTRAWLATLPATTVHAEVVDLEPTVALPLMLEEGLHLRGPIIQGETIEHEAA